MSKRTDTHRPGAIVPAEYEIVLSYNCSTYADNWPVSSFGVNCELDRRTVSSQGEIVRNGSHDAEGVCCFIGARLHGEKFAVQGSPGKCDVCGTAHIYGDIWRHKPTGELIVVGHICAHNYGLLADRSAFELGLGRRKAAAARECAKARDVAERAAFLTNNPGLAEALELDHPILCDLKAKLHQYRSLSDKQVAFAFRLADEVNNPKPVEKYVEAPTGRVKDAVGTIVSIKEYEGFAYGQVNLKMVVKVETPEGCWLAFMTLPSSCRGAHRGDVVVFSATLKAGREKHFALGSRPSATIIEAAQVADQVAN